MEKQIKVRFLKRVFKFLSLAYILTAIFAAYADSPSSGDEKLISMDFKNTSLKDVLKMFSIQSGLNFVASQDTQDKMITLYLDNVTAEDALKKILSANKLTYELEPESNIFVVKALPEAAPAPEEVVVETVTRIYRLKYARVSTTTPAGFGTAATAPGAGGLSVTPRAVTGIDKLIPQLLSKYGSYGTDERTNSLIIKDIPSQFPVIEETIAKLDVPTRQVMLEAELLEVSISDLKRAGIEWGGSKGEMFIMTGSKRATAFPFSENIFSSAARATGSDGAITKGSYDFSQLVSTLRMFISQGNARFLARPRVLVLDNESAVIKISENTAVGITSTSVSQTGTVISTAERMETGISLKVTPQINEDDFVTMFIEPSVTRPVASEFFPTQFVDPQVRGVSSIVRVKDDETVIIGGLLRTDYSKANRKVPVLGDIPVIGAPFKDTNKSERETELVIFITPRIIKESPQMAKVKISEDGAPETRQTRIREALWQIEKRLKK